jgi:hypothetical protein
VTRILWLLPPNYASAAATSSRRAPREALTSGPFAETTEQIAGYEVIECADLDEAIEVAGGHPTAARFSVDGPS